MPLASTRTSPHAPDQDLPAPRAALAWAAGGALWLVAGLVHAGDGWRFDAASVLWLAADALVVVGLLDLRRLRLHGGRRTGTLALAVALVARIGFILGEIATLAAGHDENPFIPLSAMLTALSMVAYGGTVLRERRVLGIGRFAPVAMGLYPFLVMFPAVAATGDPNYVLVGLWGVPTATVALTVGGRSPRR